MKPSIDRNLQHIAEIYEMKTQLGVERAARLRAEAADAAKDAFVERLGHQWRTPLGTIAAAADVLDGLAWTDEPLAREACDVIRRQAMRLARQIDTVLDATRVIGGQVELTRRRGDLAEVARQAVVAAEATGLAGHCELRLTSCEVQVDIDPERVTQAIGQLLSNALRVTPTGGEVEVEVGEDTRGAFVRVADCGPGLDPLEAAQLFGPRPVLSIDALRPFGSVPVAGIGIRFVTALMTALGGRCELDTSHRGTAVTLRFAPSSPDERPVRTPALTRTLKVLLVDDGDASEPVRQWLEAAGHAVATTRQVHALGRIAALRPDVTMVALAPSAASAVSITPPSPPTESIATVEGASSAFDQAHDLPLALAREVRAAGYAGRMVALLGVPPENGVAARRLRVAGFDADLVLPLDADSLRDEIARV